MEVGAGERCDGDGRQAPRSAKFGEARKAETVKAGCERAAAASSIFGLRHDVF
jgi:hypothetical protein